MATPKPQKVLSWGVYDYENRGQLLAVRHSRQEARSLRDDFVANGASDVRVRRVELRVKVVDP